MTIIDATAPAICRTETPSAVALVPDRPTGALELSDGARAQIEDEALVLRDGAGRLLIRYADGNAEVFAPERDLKLAAPRGRVVLEAATDVAVHAGRDVEYQAGRTMSLGAAHNTQQLELSPQRTHLSASRLDVDAKQTRVAAGRATLMARTISTSAERIAQRVERYELTADTIVEKTRDALRDASGLAQSRLGRAKTFVSQTFSLHSRRTTLVSTDETSIDGERILLG